MSAESTTTVPRRTWPLIVAGMVFLFLGPASYVALIAMQHLITPWHMPILMTIGALLMMTAFVRRPGVLRGVVVALALLPTVFAWLLVAVFSRSAEYTGPATVGNKLPAFAASYSDGKSFTNDSLGGPAILLFYRGHW
jgi:hypothetical protein